MGRGFQFRHPVFHGIPGKSPDHLHIVAVISHRDGLLGRNMQCLQEMAQPHRFVEAGHGYIDTVIVAQGVTIRAIPGVEGIADMSENEAIEATIAAVKKLGADVGIPANLKGILKEEDVRFLSESAFADACRPGNPRETSVEEIAELYRGLL